MTFSEKIRKIVMLNSLGITSPSSLEDYIKAGTGAITTPMRKGEEPGTATVKKIIEKLRINQDWWETGKGEVFASQPEMKNGLRDIDIIEAENYIGMHKRVYDSLEKSLQTFQQLATQAQRNVNDLTQILSRRSTPENDSPQV